MRPHLPSPARALLALSALFAWHSPSPAQPPAPANPQAPNLAPVVPLGIQRGTSLELTLTGSNLAEPTGLWTSFPAKVTIPAEGGNGKDNAKLRVKLEVGKDAPLGFHTLRLATKRGMSNARLFCVDELPQVMETATNHSLKTAQAVPVPCVVSGKADAEVTDYFKVTVKAGQRLSFEVLGRRLGSPFDPQLSLLDPATGKELPGGYSNDAPGLQTDARLSYTFKHAGDVAVAVSDVTYRGGPDFHYRLRIGDFPCATTPLPLAAKRGSKVNVRFAGPAVMGVTPVEVSVPNEPTLEAIQVAPKGASGLHGWPVSLAMSDLDEALEKEPNNEPAKANRLAVPGAVTGRFEEKEDVDHYVFSAKKGKRYLIEAQTGELGSPTEVYMTLRNAKGAQLQATNPMAAPRLDFTAAEDGDYTLAVEHLHSWGGPDEVYRLTVVPFTPSFHLTVSSDRFDVPPGGTVSVPIYVTRNGYDGAIEVSVGGAKGLSGKVTVPAGPKPPNVPSAMLPLKADDLPSGPLVFRIEGKAKIDGKEVKQYASARGAISRSLANLPLPPRPWTLLAAAVTTKPPFSLAAKFDAGATPPGKPAGLTVTATRVAGFTGPINVSVAGLPPTVAGPVNGVIPMRGNEVKLKLMLNPAAPVGQFLATVTGTASHEGRPYAVRAAPAALVVKK